MKAYRKKCYCGVLIALFSLLCTLGCHPQKPKDLKPIELSENEVDPEIWGKNYPVHYDMWKSSSKPTPYGLSRYKRGWDEDRVIYDKLSQYPFMALLYSGWGFGIEYNEPRSHYYRMEDLLEIDPTRVKPGAVCLTCKSPYAPDLEKRLGSSYYKKSLPDGVSEIPEKHRKLGDSCLDCHSPKDMQIRISRGFTLVKGLKSMGVDADKVTHNQLRSLVCAQCHSTYVIPRDKEMKPTGLFFPWQRGSLGKISVENIIEILKSQPSYREWTQSVTGFQLPFIRHPEFELFSNGSIHWNSDVSCSDCHMPYMRIGSFKVSNHRIMSPLKDNLRACSQCHVQSVEWLKTQVFNTQDRVVSMLIRAGYHLFTVAKLFEMAKKVEKEGRRLDNGLMERAKALYEEGFLRFVFIGAENSLGFHNPIEAMRVIGDSIAYASKAEAAIRTSLSSAHIYPPIDVNLELDVYLNARGKKRLKFKHDQEFKDPFGVQRHLTDLLR